MVLLDYVHTLEERTLEEPSINVWRQTIDVPESKNIIHKFGCSGSSYFLDLQ